MCGGAYYKTDCLTADEEEKIKSCKCDMKLDLRWVIYES